VEIIHGDASLEYYRSRWT